MPLRIGRASGSNNDTIRSLIGARTGSPHNAAAYKSFLSEHFGVRTDARSVQEIDRAMRRRGACPPKLSEVIDRIERVALQT